MGGVGGGGTRGAAPGLSARGAPTIKKTCHLRSVPALVLDEADALLSRKRDEKEVGGRGGTRAAVSVILEAVNRRGDGGAAPEQDQGEVEEGRREERGEDERKDENTRTSAASATTTVMAS